LNFDSKTLEWLLPKDNWMTDGTERSREARLFGIDNGVVSS